MKKTVLITGASGMTGGIILQECLKDNRIKKVISIARRPSGLEHPKLKELIHQDFNDFSSLEKNFKNIDIAYFAIGVYTGQVSDEKFKEITVDYTKAFADTIAKHSPKVIFSFLSGAGADPKEKSRVSFARYKGMAENYLISKNFRELYIFRPGYIYPVEKRKEPNFSYRLMQRMYPLIKLFGSKYSLKSTELAQAMYQSGFKKPGKSILENQDIILFFE